MGVQLIKSRTFSILENGANNGLESIVKILNKPYI